MKLYISLTSGLSTACSNYLAIIQGILSVIYFKPIIIFFIIVIA